MSTTPTSVLDGATLGLAHGTDADDLAVSALRACEALGYELPAEVKKAADAARTARERATTVPPPTPFTAADLAAKDWTVRLAAAATSAETHGRALILAGEAERQTRAGVGVACRAALPAAGDWLEAWLTEHADELVKIEGPRDTSESLARIEDREHRVTLFRNAHGALMRAGSGRRDARVRDYRAQFWTTHTWTPQQWQTLEDSTGPQLATSRPFALAQEIGATLRLARTVGQPWDDFVAMQQPVEDERIVKAFHEKRMTVIGAQW